MGNETVRRMLLPDLRVSSGWGDTPDISLVPKTSLKKLPRSLSTKSLCDGCFRSLVTAATRMAAWRKVLEGCPFVTFTWMPTPGDVTSRSSRGFWRKKGIQGESLASIQHGPHHSHCPSVTFCGQRQFGPYSVSSFRLKGKGRW